MITYNLIVMGLFLIVLTAMLVNLLVDYRRKREIVKYPFISFLIPTYKDADMISGTIKSIYSSYKKGKFEIFVLNDCSPDNTLDVLKKLRKTYKFNVITNKKNLGKSASINNAFKRTKGDVIFIVDSDTNLNKGAVNDIVARLNDKRIGGVSCRYRPKNEGFFAAMQTIEYGMLGLVQISSNEYSTLSFWGGCMAIKRKVFEKAGKLSENAIIEDADLALKIGGLGYLAQESQYAIESDVPDSFKSWYKQKIRWTSGFMQNLIKHGGYFIKHPVAITLLCLYGIMSIFFMYTFVTTLVNLRAVGFDEDAILRMIGNYLFYPLFSIPYVMMNMPKWKKNPFRLLLVFPYAMIYFPLLAIATIHGFIKGILIYKKLKSGKRGW